MSVSWPKVAATQFTAYMAMQNLSNSFGGKMAGWLDAHWSVPQVYLLFGLFQIGLIGLLLLIDPRQTRRVLGNGEPDPDDPEPAAGPDPT